MVATSEGGGEAANAPSPDSVRRVLAGLDPRQQKIVIGLFGAMIQNAARVQDREWVAQQLAEVVVMAGEFPADTPDAGVAAVEGYLREHADALLRAAFLVFQRVGLDLAPKVEEGFGFDEALRLAIGYLPGGVSPDPPGSS